MQPQLQQQGQGQQQTGRQSPDGPTTSMVVMMMRTRVSYGCPFLSLAQRNRQQLDHTGSSPRFVPSWHLSAAQCRPYNSILSLYYNSCCSPWLCTPAGKRAAAAAGARGGPSSGRGAGGGLDPWDDPNSLFNLMAKSSKPNGAAAGAGGEAAAGAKPHKEKHKKHKDKDKSKKVRPPSVTRLNSL